MVNTKYLFIYSKILKEKLANFAPKAENKIYKASSLRFVFLCYNNHTQRDRYENE